MQITNSTEIFQQNMNDLFHEFEFILAYIDELLIKKRRLEISCTEVGINSKKTEGKRT